MFNNRVCYMGVFRNVPNSRAGVTLFDSNWLLLILMIFHNKSMFTWSYNPVLPFIHESQTYMQRIRVIMWNTKNMVLQISLTVLWQVQLHNSATGRPILGWLGPNIDSPHKTPSLQQASGNTEESGKGGKRVGWREAEGELRREKLSEVGWMWDWLQIVSFSA